MEKSAMTQEELDALMAGDIDLDEEVAEADEVSQEESKEFDESDEDKKVDHFRVDPSAAWPPPPPTNDHQVVNQLDDVTKASEVKATEIFDKLESINEMLMNIEGHINPQREIILNNIDIFQRLSSKFENIESFKSALEQNQEALKQCDSIISEAQSASDEVMMTMDVMQYQDIHRQKIERVINVMRALSSYMNMLFHSNVDDESRVGSAIHIDGDGTEDVATADDIEELIASFGK